MTNLIKVDLKRILKDKLFLITIIIAVAFAFLTPLLYLVLFNVLEFEIEGPGLETIGFNVSSKTLLFSAFSLSNNFGMILPIFISVIICKDFSYGTIRNKIICGNSRSKIFLSMFISSCIILCGVILAHALLTFGVSSIFFDYQEGAFTYDDFLYLIESIGLQMLVFIFIAAMISLFCTIAKNAGLSIVMNIAVMLGSTLIVSILSIFVPVLEVMSDNQALVDVLNFVLDINVFGINMNVGLTQSYELTKAITYIVAMTSQTALLIFLGLLNFNKKDLK